MLNRAVTADFSDKCGKIKPINALNGGPLLGGASLPYDFSEEYREMNIPFVRVAGRAGEFGFNQRIDVHCIFPDPTADEMLPESYNFLPTDKYLLAVRECGASIFFRLGESAEPFGRNKYAVPPEDKEKWARICEHIIMHYNEGWADGFKLGIKYVEIWSSPDTSDGFSGDATEFFELYRVTANYLRERFPRIKLGGYSSGGFASLNRIGAGEREAAFVEFMQKFLAYVGSEKGRSPLDFFTWECCASTPEELSVHSRYARSYLDNAGFKRTKSIISSFNIAEKLNTPPVLSADYPAELAAALILAQREGVEMVIYSSTEPGARDSALFCVDEAVNRHRYAAYRVMRAIGKLYKLGTAVNTTGDYRKELYTLGAVGGGGAMLLVVTGEWSGRLEISIRGGEFTACDVEKIVGGGTRGEGRTLFAEGVAVTGNKILLPAKRKEVYLISLK